jgi:hypothetical protein
MKKLGNIDQMAWIRDVTFNSGKAEGVKALLCKNEKLSLTLLESMALDILDLSYAGNNLSFISKNGLVSRKLANTQAYDFLRSFNGGFLLTCGLDNIGNPFDNRLVHGSLSSIPACITKAEVLANEDGYVLEVEGKIHDSGLFLKDIELVRNYKIYNNRIKLTDTVRNLDFNEQDIIMMYHFNLGYPMLDDCTTIKANYSNTECRTTDCRLEEYSIMKEPVDMCPEEVFIHSISDKHADILIQNPRLGQNVRFNYSTGNLKYLTEWKSMRSRDYALGIEPSTSHLDRKEFIRLAPGQSIQNSITIGF